MKGGVWASIFRTKRQQQEEVEAVEKARRAARLLGPARAHERVREEPAVRRPAPARGGARARDRARAAAARRADRRHEPGGDGAVHGAGLAAARRAVDDGADDRARHARRHGHLRPRDGARLRPEDRRGLAHRGAAEPARDRGLPRHAGGDRLMAAAAEPILRLDDVHTYYGTIHALKGITLEVREGEVVTLIGSNGAGKSTTLRSINGLNQPRDGHDPLPGRGHHQAPRARDRPHGHLAVARGPPRLQPHDRAREPRDGRLPAQEGRRGRRGSRPRLRPLPAARRAQEPEGRDALRRRAADGRDRAAALMARPKLLLLDEPSMGLAPIFVERIFEIIKTINEQGTLDPARRAERADGARRRRPRLRARDRPDRPRGRGQAACKTNEEVRKTYLGE